MKTGAEAPGHGAGTDRATRRVLINSIGGAGTAAGSVGVGESVRIAELAELISRCVRMSFVSSGTQYNAWRRRWPRGSVISSPRKSA